MDSQQIQYAARKFFSSVTNLNVRASCIPKPPQGAACRCEQSYRHVYPRCDNLCSALLLSIHGFNQSSIPIFGAANRVPATGLLSKSLLKNGQMIREVSTCRTQETIKQTFGSLRSCKFLPPNGGQDSGLLRNLECRQPSFNFLLLKLKVLADVLEINASVSHKC